ncbi:MAG: hypothetical protein ACFE9L_08700 [Candidatus Hodarchaeota archaeon]
MPLPEIVPLELSQANPGDLPDRKGMIRLAQYTGTNGPRDLFSSFEPNFFEKYSLAFLKALGQEEIVIGYDGSLYHELISNVVQSKLRISGNHIYHADKPCSVPEFMFLCKQVKRCGLFFGRSHSPRQYIGLKLVISANSLIKLFSKAGWDLDSREREYLEGVYGFLPKSAAPIIEDELNSTYKMVSPQRIGKIEMIDMVQNREEFVSSISSQIPISKIEGDYIIDCRHSMAGLVWELIAPLTQGNIQLTNNKLNPIAEDRDPRTIWDKLSQIYTNNKQGVFSHDADADRIFLIKPPGENVEIIKSQEKAFALGIMAEYKVNPPEEYIFVQERLNLTILKTLEKLSSKIFATSQGEPPFFIGLIELLLKYPHLSHISGADYTDIFFSRQHPIAMKMPFLQTLWSMYWFTNDDFPLFPISFERQIEISIPSMNYVQRLKFLFERVHGLEKYLTERFQIISRLELDGRWYLLSDINENFSILSLRPSGTTRAIKAHIESSSEDKNSKKDISALEKYITKNFSI